MVRSPPTWPRPPGAASSGTGGDPAGVAIVEVGSESPPEDATTESVPGAPVAASTGALRGERVGLPEGSLLAALPENAFALLHSRDPVALRERAERNDWVALCASPEGASAFAAIEAWFARTTGAEFDRLLEVALELRGEAVLFDTGAVAGFLTVPPADPAALSSVLDGWLAPDARRTIEIAGRPVRLAPWSQIGPDAGPMTPDGLIAHLDHPLAMGLFSASDEASLVEVLTETLGRLGGSKRAPLVDAYLAAGGGAPRGIEAYVDLTPLVPVAERALREALEGVLPDPTGLLGLEAGTALFVSADLFAGTHVDVRAELTIHRGTLAAELADTFEPLPRTWSADLPRGTWYAAAIDWNLARFYARARAAFEAESVDGLVRVDQGIAVAEALSGVDPVADVIEQLTGAFTLYHVLDPEEGARVGERGFGFLAGLVDGERFLDAFEAMMAASGIVAVSTEFEGAEAYLIGTNGFLADRDETTSQDEGNSEEEGGWRSCRRTCWGASAAGRWCAGCTR